MFTTNASVPHFSWKIFDSRNPFSSRCNRRLQRSTISVWNHTIFDSINWGKWVWPLLSLEQRKFKLLERRRWKSAHQINRFSARRFWAAQPRSTRLFAGEPNKWSALRGPRADWSIFMSSRGCGRTEIGNRRRRREDKMRIAHDDLKGKCGAGKKQRVTNRSAPTKMKKERIETDTSSAVRRR